MAKSLGKKSKKKLFLWGIPALLVGLVLVLVAVYFWQIRLQKPVEVNMAHHHHEMSADMASMPDHSHASSAVVACEAIVETDTTAPVKTYELVASKTVISLGNGKTKEAWTFNGTSPGPELRVTEGDKVVVTLKNKDIEDGVTLHWHGINVPCSQDGVAGVSQDAVAPGEQFTYSFVADEPGTYWYHSHQMSSIQARMGLLGSIVVLPKSTGAKTEIMDVNAIYQELDSTPLLNGSTEGLTLDGHPGDRVRLRLTNAGNGTLRFRVDGASFQVAAMDGHELNEPGPLQDVEVPVGAGQRYDLLFRIPDSHKVVVRSDSLKNLPITIGEGTVPPESEGKEKFSFVDYGSPLAEGQERKPDADRSFELKLGQSLFVNTINGRSFHEIPPMNVKEGETVRITIVNEGGGYHPFHIHGHTFRVWSKNGVPLTGSPVYLDTLLTTKGDRFEVTLTADNPGLWMAHCHNLEHASMGMSMMLNYEGVTTSYTVGTRSGNLPDL
jgi:Putative multicopper oxidases